MADKFRVRPSELLAIADPLTAYYLDRAVHTFGTAVVADIKEQTKDAKTQSAADRTAATTLGKWLNTTEKQFRDPAKENRV